MRRTFVGAALCAFVLTGCGSTVQVQDAQGRAVQDGESLGSTTLPDGQAQSGSTAGLAGGDVGPGTTDVADGGSGPVGAGAGAPVTRASASGRTAVAPGTVGAATGGAVAPPPGTALAPIEVGVLLYPDLNDFAGQFGGSANTGDQDLIVETAVKWVNANGGAAGHPVKAVKHYVELTSADTYDQLAQQACEDFTVDHKAVAVLAPGTSVSNNFAACLQKKGALLLLSGKWIHDAKDWQQYPNMYSPGEADGAEVGQAMVDQVLARGLAKRGEKVGLMVMDQPGALRTMNSVIKPKLKAAGIEVVAYEVPVPASTAGIGNSVATNNSAVLRMASEGIKTAMFLCPGCLSFFADQAQSQGYFPTYVVSSYDTLAGIRGDNFDRTMAKAVAVGWMPDSDVGLHANPRELTGNPTRDLCKKIMAPIKQNTDDLSEYATQVICDGFLQVKHAAELNPANPLTGPALQRGTGLFGTRHPSALNFTTVLTAARHGGSSTYRTLRWDTGRSAFVYESATRRTFR